MYVNVLKLRQVMKHFGRKERDGIGADSAAQDYLLNAEQELHTDYSSLASREKDRRRAL